MSGTEIAGTGLTPTTLTASPTIGMPSTRDVILRIATDHPAFAGHFPGQPLLPGVSLLAEVLEAVLDDAASAALVGATPRLAMVKFLAPVRPGAELRLQLETGPRGVRFEVWDTRSGGRIAASGQFEAAR